MTLLLAALLLAPVIDWSVALLLLRASRRYPHVRALRERAVVAVAIAFGTSVYVGAAFNAASGFSVWDMETTQLIARIAVASIGLVPLWWLWLWFRSEWD